MPVDKRPRWDKEMPRDSLAFGFGPPWCSPPPTLCDSEKIRTRCLHPRRPGRLSALKCKKRSFAYFFLLTKEMCRLREHLGSRKLCGWVCEEKEEEKFPCWPPP